MKKIVAFSFWFITVFSVANAQAIKVAEQIGESQLSPLADQKLMVVDFWASWCAPCIPATRQMEIYQDLFKDEIYFIAISDEYYGTITNHLKKHPIKLAVYQDADNYTFRKYNVTARPHVAVINTKGKLMWEGKPGDLSPERLQKLLKNERNRQSAQLASIIEYESIEAETTEVEEVTELEVDFCNGDCTEQLEVYGDYVDYQGKLSHLLATLFGVADAEVIMEYPDININAKVPYSQWSNYPEQVATEVTAQFGLEVLQSTKEMDFQELVLVDKTKLWDDTQINWGNEDNKVLVGTSRIEADDISLAELATLLSKEKKDLFIYRGEDAYQRDWDFHYKYSNLMKSELHDQFGIDLRPMRSTIPVLLVR
ncbi:hypothetical protein DN752_24040 [Echinicola strongylocentroti]|uniref:Thioredoxin domain-containing protein n=1 Tax=Echinicola strongylocentroti TaxID=1795355 RepID=A0A2Z4IQM7_9BACT|nr:TlpA disulfide reductase family protein [Echinicola strongylocentroti]AWW32948.1 hypothetical protein DN752_24040 [Echinicola strongylocentroti]